MSDPIFDMMREVFSDLGLDNSTAEELKELVAIHGRVLGAAALEFRIRQRKFITEPLGDIDPILDRIRGSVFEAPLSGRDLIAALADTLDAETLRYLLLASYLIVQASSEHAKAKSSSLVDALDDVITHVGYSAATHWGDQELTPVKWSQALFESARRAAEHVSGREYFRASQGT